MEKILLCVLLATGWALAFEGRRFSANINAPFLSRQTDMFPTEPEKLFNDNTSKDSRHRAMKTALANMGFGSTVDCGSPTPAEGTDVVFRSTGLNAVASYKCKDGFFNTQPGQQTKSFCQNDGHWSMVNVKCASKSKDRRIDDLEIKVEKLLNDNKVKDILLRDIESALASLASELSVDCGSPAAPEGTDVVYSSTGVHAMASYRCKEGFHNIHPGQQMMSLCQKDGQWTLVNVKCVNLSGCWIAHAGRASYAGTRSTTITGKVCQRWDSQHPHKHDFNKDTKFWIPGFDNSQTVTGTANYCRDPSHAGFVWCYTTDRGSRWEKCDVPKCNIQN